jgi:hypothetical protein
MTKKNMLKLFVNDLLVNSACRRDKNYVENKRKEWGILKNAPKQKTVTSIRDRRFLT